MHAKWITWSPYFSMLQSSNNTVNLVGTRLDIEFKSCSGVSPLYMIYFIPLRTSLYQKFSLEVDRGCLCCFEMTSGFLLVETLLFVKFSL